MVGGLGFAPAGATLSATQDLEPGSYVVFDIESGTMAAFDVGDGQGAAKLPTPAARIEATEYEFKAAGLQVGKNPVLFDNRGREPHVIAAAPIKPGKTIEDVRRYSKDEKGEDPTESEGAFETAVLDGGVKQVIEIDLKRAGSYVLLCYVPDRAGGPPHLIKGMVSEAVVR